MSKEKAIVKEKAVEDVEKSDEIVVRDPQILRPVELPLVVILPEGASKAQKEYVNILNAYAYQNPDKWAVKKDILVAKLKELKNAPDPVEENARLSVGRKLPA